jgi:hypothetical protein
MGKLNFPKKSKIYYIKFGTIVMLATHNKIFIIYFVSKNYFKTRKFPQNHLKSNK